MQAQCLKNIFTGKKLVRNLILLENGNMKNKIFLTVLTVAMLLPTSCRLNPNKLNAYIITYVTDKGETPEQIALVEGAKLKKEHLPQIETDYFELDGWYKGDKKIKPGYEIEENLTLTAKWELTGYEYKITDTSNVEVNPTGNTTFAKDEGGYTKATPTNGGSISNWVINYPDNRTKPAYGFEASIKCDSNIGWAGIQWFTGASGYDCYYFEVGGDGTFKIQSHIGDEWKTLVNYPATSSGIIKNDYNTVVMEGTKMSDFIIYVNGTKMYTIKSDELKITPGFLAFAANGKKGTAWLKLTKVQQVK